MWCCDCQEDSRFCACQVSQNSEARLWRNFSQLQRRILPRSSNHGLLPGDRVQKTVVDPSHNPAPYTLNPHAFHPTTEPLNPKPSTQDGARPASDVSRLRTLTKSKYDRTNTRAPGWGFSRSFGSTRFTKCLKRTSSASVH